MHPRDFYQLLTYDPDLHHVVTAVPGRAPGVEVYLGGSRFTHQAQCGLFTPHRPLCADLEHNREGIVGGFFSTRRTLVIILVMFSIPKWYQMDFIKLWSSVSVAVQPAVIVSKIVLTFSTCF